ncbi:leucine-rich repeat domain-containing protein [Gemella bergeri]
MKNKTILKITSGVLSGVVVLSGISQLGKIDVQAKEKIEVKANKDLQISIKEQNGGAVVDIIAVRDVNNVNVKITIDGEKVISYHINSLKAGQKEEKVISKEQLENFKRQLKNLANKRVLPNTASVKKNIESKENIAGSEIKVEVTYYVEEDINTENGRKEDPKQPIEPNKPINPIIPEDPSNPVNPGDQDQEVIINDPLLKKLINKNIDAARDDNQKITKSEIEKLKVIKLRDKENKAILERKSLKGTQDFKFVSTCGIKDLSGLEKAINLEELNLDENEITDLTPLANLKKLKHLSLFRNRITNLAPLADLTNLEFLDLYSNKLTDISSLKNLVNLKHLDLHNNNDQTGDESHPTVSGGIKDISAVANMTKLEVLSLGSNDISDISVLTGLTNIKELVLGGNHIKDYSKVVDYIVPRIVKMINEEGGSIKFDGQKINYGKEVEVNSKNVSIPSPFAGINEIGKKLAKQLESEEDINFFSDIKTNVEGVSATYNAATSNFELTFTDEFIKQNNGKTVPVNLKLGFEEYTWSLTNIKIKVNKKAENPVVNESELRNKLEVLIKRDIRSEEGYIPNEGNQPNNNKWIEVRTKAEQVLADNKATKEQIEQAITSLEEATYNAILGSEKVKARKTLISLGKFELIPQITKATTIEKVKKIVSDVKGDTEEKPTKPDEKNPKQPGDNNNKPIEPEQPVNPTPEQPTEKAVITGYEISNKVLESNGGSLDVVIKGKNLTVDNVRIKVLDPFTATKNNNLTAGIVYKKVGDNIIATINVPSNNENNAKSYNLTFVDKNGQKVTTTYEEGRGENGRVITVLPAEKTKQDSVLSFVTISSYQAHHSTDLTTTDKGNVSKKNGCSSLWY